MDAHTRWFRRLLKMLPADFQADYARDMERTFHAQRRDAAHEHGGVVRLWFETTRDLVRTAPREHADQLLQDTRYALRTMARRPAFCSIAAGVLAIGIASTTAVFSVLQAAVLHPLPFDDPAALVAVRERTPEDPQPWELSYVSYLELRRDANTFEQLAAYMRNGIKIGGPEPELTDAVLISANLLDTLRVRPLAGRAFLPTEDAPGGPAVALVSEALARGRFGTVDHAIGGTAIIDDRPTTVVGVLPDTFRFPDDRVRVWLPIGQLADEPFMRNRAVHVALLVGRLKAGMRPEHARAEIDAWTEALQSREPASDPHHRIVLRSLSEQVSADARPAVTALAGAVLLLLAVTCSSVALLLLTPATGRSSEVAIRLSLGASRSRIARQLLTEATCLTAIGGALGIAGAHVLLAFLVRGLGDALPPLVTPRVDNVALSVAAIAATVAALLSGLAPAMQTLNMVRTTAVPRRASRTHFVTAQVAVSCVLLIVAGLLVRSLDRLLQVHLGFRADHLLVMRVTAPAARYQKQGDMTRFYRAVSTRLRALPGVAAVTATNRPPVGLGGQGDLTIEGQARRDAPVAMYRRVLPGYFGVLGIPLVEGREFTERDDGAESVVIVSRSLARRFWAPGQAVGKRIKVGAVDTEPWNRIVGVVGDVRNGMLDAGADIATYEPHTQRPWNGMIVMVRTTGDPASMTNTVRQALREVDREVLASDVSTMEERIAETVASRRFHATVVGAFAGATLLLVALALYGALAHSVASRTREIGIRAALGANGSALTQEALVEGLQPALVGLVAGLAGGAIAASAVRGLLFEVTPGDAATYGATAALLLAIAFAATWVPARRAARIDPSVALRTE